jgi:aminopeptidase N
MPARSTTCLTGPTRSIACRLARTIARLTLLLPLAGIPAMSQAISSNPGAGVSRDLARYRASHVRDVRYAIRFHLKRGAGTLPGDETVRFTLDAEAAAHGLALDYRDGALTSIDINGHAATLQPHDGHLILPAASLQADENTVKLAFTSRIAAAGAAITRFEDKDDGSEYLYSLFVPMDASMAFPCFDQPDLKARFTLHLIAPEAWTVIGNTKPLAADPHDHDRDWTFPETRPISTYLFAFAAGPWARLPGKPGEPDLYVRASQLAKARTEAPIVQSLTAAGIKFYEQYFAQPYPFPKYDLVLIPGFPFGGMEHAGETFLKEETVLFRTAPTQTERFQRDITVLHELAHQWFGDLVTMRWFDDLWLKEGFAQYMAYHAMDALHPETQPWKHFYESIKPAAYAIDETEGTTPIYQDVPNLKDAKSAYGAIVYQKAPSLLKQLEFRLGPEPFRNGLRTYLREHAYANATWADLVDALHRSSGQDVQTWADAWILRRGMPEVSVDWACDAHGRLTHLTLSQQDILPDNFVWPIANRILLAPAAGQQPQTLRVNWNTASFTVSDAVGRPCPAYVFTNAGDEAYGRFLIDDHTRDTLTRTIVADRAAFDPLLRSMLWGALWDQVHTVRWSPSAFVAIVLDDLPQEQDPDIARIQGSHAVLALHRYLSDQARQQPVTRLEATATGRMTHAPTTDLALVHFRLLTSVTETPSARDTLKSMLAGSLHVPGVDLRPLDRWNLVGKLVALGDPDAPRLLADEQKRDPSGDGQKFAWAIAAGSPNPATKAQYFAAYQLTPGTAGARPEDWITQSLGSFNAWNQADLTAPYLRRALDQLPEIKRDRKIFFLGAWLSAFLDGQTSASSLDVVNNWTAQPNLDPDLRRKVIENSDELARTVRIRTKYP